MPETFTTDQSEDFVTFVIDGQAIEVDIYQANDRLVDIDKRHLEDPSECDDCHGQFPPRINSDPVVACPHCQSTNLRPSQAFLDDVAALVRSYGPKRCSRKLAAFFYNKILESVAGLKKNTNSTPESPSTSTDSTPAN